VIIEAVNRKAPASRKLKGAMKKVDKKKYSPQPDENQIKQRTFTCCECGNQTRKDDVAIMENGNWKNPGRVVCDRCILAKYYHRLEVLR